MKKYIFGMMAAAAAVLMTSCSADEGTTPGGDSKAYVQVNTYTAQPPLDGDADFQVRVSTNSATKAAYVLLEKHADYSKHVAELGKDGYNDYVVKNGEAVEGVSGQSEKNLLYKGLKGGYMATVVAVGNNNLVQAADSASFNGITWNKVCTGSYHFDTKNAAALGLDPTVTDCELDVDAADASSYRITNVFGAGYHLKFKRYKSGGTDDAGNAFNYITVPKFNTGRTYGNYGNIYMCDAYTLTGSADYLDNGIYADNSLFICTVYSVSAGNIAVLNYDEFVPYNN